MFNRLLLLGALAAAAVALCNKDNRCDLDENCGNCPADCGACPGFTVPTDCLARQLDPASFNGECNNINNPTWGAIGSSWQRMTSAAYTDGEAAPQPGPDARNISNTVYDQFGEALSARHLNPLATFFGQFITHDMHASDAGSENGVMTADVSYPDPWMIPATTLKVTRMAVTPGTGENGKPRIPQIKSVTAFLDASAVYGSSAVCANALREGTDGLLKERTFDKGVFPPLSTEPGMEVCGMQAFTTPVSAFGDSRASENAGLFAVHVLFYRNHNYWARRLKRRGVQYTDEALYQEARAVNRALIQHIFAYEWYPSITGENLPAYTGYNKLLNPAPFVEVVAAALRLGHTMVRDHFQQYSPYYRWFDATCSGPIPANSAFFNVSHLTGDQCQSEPCAVNTECGMDSLLAGLVRDTAAEIDIKVVDTLRNMLFQNNGANHQMDLVTINLLRNRDLGSPTLNDARVQLGLPRHTTWDQVCTDTHVQFRLMSVYPTVDDVELYVGLFSEDKVNGGSTGETMLTILRNFMINLRASDRFWYENRRALHQDPTREVWLREIVELTTMRDLVELNSGAARVQPHAFFGLGADPVGLENLLQLLQFNPF